MSPLRPPGTNLGWDELLKAVQWIRRTPLLKPDAAIQSLRPESITLIESLVEEFASSAYAALRPTEQQLPMRLRILTELREISLFNYRPLAPFSLTTALIRAAQNCASAMQFHLNEQRRRELLSMLVEHHRSKAPTGALLDRLPPAYLLALYNTVWPLMYGGLRSPFAPLLALWELGVWPMLAHDGEMMVYVPREQLQAFYWYDAVAWHPIVLSGLTNLTTPWRRRLTQLTSRYAGNARPPVHIANTLYIGVGKKADYRLGAGLGIRRRHAQLVERDGSWFVGRSKVNQDSAYFRAPVTLDNEPVVDSAPVAGRTIRVGDNSLTLSAINPWVDQLAFVLGLEFGAGIDRECYRTKDVLYRSQRPRPIRPVGLGPPYSRARWMRPAAIRSADDLPQIRRQIDSLNEALVSASPFAKQLSESVLDLDRVELVSTFAEGAERWISAWTEEAAKPFVPTVWRGPLALSQLMRADIAPLTDVDACSSGYRSLLLFTRANLWRRLQPSDGAHLLAQLVAAQGPSSTNRFHALRAAVDLWVQSVWPFWMPNGAVLVYRPVDGESESMRGSPAISRWIERTQHLPGTFKITEIMLGNVLLSSDIKTPSRGMLESAAGDRIPAHLARKFARPPGGSARVAPVEPEGWQVVGGLREFQDNCWLTIPGRAGSGLGRVMVNGARCWSRPLVHGDVMTLGFGGFGSASEYTYVR